MDKLFLRQLEVSAIIGVNPQERVVPQSLWIDLEVGIDARLGAENDKISATLDYSALYSYLIDYLNSSCFQLLETLACRLGDDLLKHFSIQWLRLSIMKKPADMPGIVGAGIIIERAT